MADVTIIRRPAGGILFLAPAAASALVAFPNTALTDIAARWGHSRPNLSWQSRHVANGPDSRSTHVSR
jgi:hypothetical protein